MSKQFIAEKDRVTQRGRGCLIWFGKLLAMVLVLMLAGVIFESVAEVADAKAYPPPGKMVDVGGYRLHLNCTGSGSPTVVVETGWGDASAGWGWVQPEVAKTTRICTYDRAGMGWSEVSPQPRTAREFAKELHTLLANAHEVGPFVLVGHSLGGHTVRVYAQDYPTEVVGIILVDAQEIPATVATAPLPTPKPGRTSLPTFLARIGLVRLLSGYQNLPLVDKFAYKALSVAPRWVQTTLDEGRGMSEGGAQAKAVTTLGSMPLTVLSRGKEIDADWTAWQVSLLKLSTNSQRIIAEQSGHAIQIEQPEAAISAIIKMVEQLRK